MHCHQPQLILTGLRHGNAAYRSRKGESTSGVATMVHGATKLAASRRAVPRLKVRVAATC